ncbi:MAG: HAD family hydrolase [Blautia sp.]|nr:HAD family hydrolase [Blautia sp.]
MNKAIFLDRDGTINVEKKYLYKIEDFEFLPGVIEGLKILQQKDYLLIILTNQSGIGRGYYTEEDFVKLNDWMLQELNREGVLITKVYYCPHLPTAKMTRYRKICTCRKPALGMYGQAIKEFDIDISLSYAIGDKIRDCSICEKMGCRGFIIAENENSKVIEAVKGGKCRNIRYETDLLACAKRIAQMEG